VAALLIRSDLPSQTRCCVARSAWRELALGWRASGRDWVEAEKHFQRALELKPDLRMACEWLANARSHAKGIEEAEATLDHCQRMFPDRERRAELAAHFRKRAEALP